MSYANRYLAAARVYLKPRILLILLLGFSSGLPLALTGTTLAIWMKEFNIDLKTIGLFSLVGLPYSVKFFWAPVVDAFSIPFLTKMLGRRRAWLLFSQFLLIGSIIFLGSLDPVSSPWMVALGALLLATTSATQDIVIDAYRVERLPDEEQEIAVSYYVAAYRIAMLIAVAGVVGVTVYLKNKGVSVSDVWFYGYCFAAALIVIGIVATLLGKEPEEAVPTTTLEETKDPLSKFYQTAWQAFSEFLQKPYIISVLAFIILFKFCDALAGTMTVPFVLDIGFSKLEYAAIVKGVGLIATLVGTFVASIFVFSKLGISLWLAALLQMFSNLVFIWLAWIGPEQWALVITIVIENFTGAVGTIIFIAYLSTLCGHTFHTATQFALLTALSSVGRTVLSSSSGYIAETTGWPIFFIITTLAAVPALMLLAYLMKVGHFGDFKSQKQQRELVQK